MRYLIWIILLLSIAWPQPTNNPEESQYGFFSELVAPLEQPSDDMVKEDLLRELGRKATEFTIIEKNISEQEMHFLVQYKIENLAKHFRSRLVYRQFLGINWEFYNYCPIFDNKNEQIFGNELIAMASLNQLHKIQNKHKKNLLRDDNRNNIGEYSFPYQSPSPEIDFVKRTAHFNKGIAERSGYYFRCFLPTSENDYIANYIEDEKSSYHFTIFLPDNNDSKGKEEKKREARSKKIEMQEKGFLIYAWPVKYGKTGKRTFVIDQTGNILWTDNKTKKYSGLNNIPDSTSAIIEKLELKPGKAPKGEVWQIK